MLTNTWNTIKTWASDFWNKAWTKIWAQLQLVGAALLAIASYLGSVINDPSVKSAVGAVSMPTWAVLGIAVFGAVTLLSVASKD